MAMGKLNKILGKMEASPKNVRFSELCKVCDRYFGRARQHGTSHRIYKTPWTNDPWLNIQEDRGMAKAYQVRQVLAAVKRLEEENEPEK
jgi:hypothetical protein